MTPHMTFPSHPFESDEARTLIAEKYIEKQSNGRFAVAERPERTERPPAAAPPEPRPPDEDELANDVIRRSLCGHDDFMREEVTAEL